MMEYLLRNALLFCCLIGLLFFPLSQGVANELGNLKHENRSPVVEGERYHPNRLIVKFKKDSQVANSLRSKGKPTASDLTGPEWAKLKSKHNIKQIKRVFSGSQGIGVEKRAAKTAEKFSKRKSRSTSTHIPDLENIYVMSLGAPGKLKHVVDDLLKNTDIEAVEPDYLVNVLAAPNDLMYGDLWGLHPAMSRVEDAWNITKGAGVIVAIIDSGVDYNHADLNANAWINTLEIPNNGIDEDGNGYVDDYYGYDFSARDADPADENGHGTHVAGTVAAVGNNGIGVIGVAPDAKFMSIRGLNAQGSGYVSDLSEAINYAVDMGADVINNSWGGGGFSSTMNDAIAYAHTMGTVVVAAAGNDNNNLAHYPSGYDNVLSVTAIDSTRSKASFSNYGTRVDVAAPGVEILSTMPEYPVYLNAIYGLDENYSHMNGTSMASPHVAGQAALVLSANPTYSVEQIVDSITLSSNPQVNSAEYLGTGIMDALQSSTLVEPPANVSVEITSPSYGKNINTSPTLIADVIGATYTLSLTSDGPYSTNWTPVGSGESGLDITLSTIDVALLSEGENFVKLAATGSDGYERHHVMKLDYDNQLMNGWPKQLSNYFGDPKRISSSPIIANFDGMPGNEILTMCEGPNCDVLLVRADGSAMPGWPVKMTVDEGTPAVADLDNDGDLEIVIVVGYPEKQLYVLHHDGSHFIPPVALEGRGFDGHTPVIGDINGDGNVDIVVPTIYANTSFVRERLIVTALDLQGNTLTGWPFYIDGINIISRDSLVMADFNFDGAQEIFISTGDQGSSPRVVTHYLLDGFGNVLSGWPKTVEGLGVQRPAIGDIDLDGELDIVVFDDSVGGDNFHRYDQFGNEPIGWPKSTIYRPSSAITLSDMDGNGTLEIIHQDYASRIYIYDHNGTLLPGWPVRVVQEFGVAPNSFDSSVITGDVDGDGQIDLVFGSAGSEEVYALSNTGEVLPGFPKGMDRGTYSGTLATPTVGDIDNDGDLDLVAGDVSGKLYAWDLAGSYLEDSWKWPQYGRDLHNTSFSNRMPILDMIGTQIVSIGETLSFGVSAMDDSLEFTISADQLPDGASFDAQSHLFTWTPHITQVGSSFVLFTVSDGEYSDSELVEIIVQNGVAPVFDAIGDKVVNEGSLLEFTVSATDGDGDALTYSALNLPTGATFDPATQTFSWVPGYGQQGIYYSVLFEVSDGYHIMVASITITVSNVNRAPTLDPIGDQTIEEGTLLSFNITGNDPDGDTLSFSATGLPTGAVFDSTTGAFTWNAEIKKGKNGNLYTVTFGITDGEFTLTETITITVSKAGRTSTTTTETTTTETTTTETTTKGGGKKK